MITFQDKVALNENIDIPEVNKITDDNINDLKAGINTNETDINNIKSAMAYSTNEVKTNKVWIDGKPIYRKVIEQYIENTNNGDIAIGLSNIDDIWIDSSSTYFIWDSHPWKTPIFYEKSTNYFSLYINGTNIHYSGKLSDYNLTGTVYITLEYTKTTD